MNLLRALCAVGFLKILIARAFTPSNESLRKSVLGLNFRNPVGLGAGFDKNAKYIRELHALGFGFIEIGTVTPRPQEGNPKPRLFRLSKDEALINRMGFNNDGVQIATQRLKQWRQWEARQGKGYERFVVGGNIGKNKSTPNENAVDDYEICFKTLHPFVDFFVVNVSSPNTPGLRELQEKESLRRILTRLQQMNQTFPDQKPLLLKIAPDLSDTQLHDVIALANEIQLDGLVAANTTINRNNLKTDAATLDAIGAGGLSGLPLSDRANEVLQYISERTKIPVIASGGIFEGDAASDRMKKGASLIEVWTAFIYRGPLIVKKICRQLA